MMFDLKLTSGKVTRAKVATLLGAVLTTVVVLTVIGIISATAARSDTAPVSEPAVTLAAQAAPTVTTTTMPFGYYGLEWPVENTGFSPRVYIDSGMKPMDIPYVLDIAAAGGVQVLQYIPPGVLSLPLSELRDHWISPTLNHEALFGFYPSEEPGESEIGAMRDLLNLVHETDPQGRPVVTYLGYYNISNIIKFRDTVDVDILGAYPVFKGFPQALMTGMMDSGRQALWPVGKRFYAAPETFGPILSHVNGPALLRNNTYQAVIGGADGIIFYNAVGFDGSQYPAFRAELGRLREEFVGSGGLGQVVLSPDPPQAVSHTIVSGPTNQIELEQFEYLRYYDRLQYHLEVYQGQVYLLAANIGGDEVGVRFAGFPTVATSADVLFEERTLPVSGGTFEDTFGAYEIHVYRAPGDLSPGFVLAVDYPTQGLVTNTPTITVSGSVTPVAAVSVGGMAAGVSAGGAFSLPVTLSEGSQVVTVSTSSAVVTRTVTLDTVPPDTGITAVEGEDVPPFTFSWDASDSGSGVDMFNYRFDDGDWSFWTASQVVTFRDDLGLPTGVHTFSVRARDRAGNADPTPATVALNVIATSPPLTPSITGPATGVTDIAYTFSLVATDPDGDQVAYRCFWDDGTTSPWSELAPSGTSVSLSYAWSEGGTYRVRVQARDEHGRTIPWSDTPFHKIGIAGPITRSIPFGYYGLESPVENTGFSPRVYIDSGMKPMDIPYVLDIAAAGGVQVLQYIPPGVLSLPLSELRDHWISPTLNHEALFGFYPSEEPGESEIGAMRDLLNLVHETDPQGRPVVTYLGYYNISNIVKFRDTVDVDIMGAYPVFKGFPQALMTGVMDSGRQALWPVGKRFYAAPETFGPILSHADGPALLRNNTYQAVIGGADGIIFYNAVGFDGSQYPAFRAELGRLREEFVGTGGLGQVVLSPDPPQVVSHTILSGPTTQIELEQFEYLRYYDRLQYHLEVYQGQVYLLAANIGADELVVRFEGFPTAATSADVLFEGRTLPVSGGIFQDTFGAYQVHVYRALVDEDLLWQTIYLPIVARETTDPL